MKTDLVVAGYIFDSLDNDRNLLLIYHNKLDLWLPVGGHIEKNETPDDALLREIKEESGLDVKILDNSPFIPVVGNTKMNLATPFYVNVHSVGDHDHLCFFYLCKALNPGEVRLNNEVRNYLWVNRDELVGSNCPEDVKYIGSEAFRLTGEFF